jgi:hypothetical protein
MRLLWSLMREATLADYRQQNPGTRPGPWYAFDAPAGATPLRIGGPAVSHLIAGSGRWMIQVMQVLEYRHFKARYGDPRVVAWPELYADGDLPVWESEAGLLRRLRALDDDELRRIPASDFLPRMLPRWAWLLRPPAPSVRPVAPDADAREVLARAARPPD